MKRSILSILGMMVLFLGLVACSASNAKEDNTKNKPLVVGLECDYAPYNWTTTKAKSNEFSLPIDGSKGYCSGYDIWMSKQIAKDLKRDVVIKKLAWDGLIPALNNKQIDLIIAGMAPTEERQKQIAFSDAYFEETPSMTVVVKKDGQYANAKTLKDLSDSKISAQQGTLHVKLLEQIPNNQNKGDLPDYNSLIQATKSGSIDGYLVQETTAQVQVDANKDLKFIDITKLLDLSKASEIAAIGMRKDDNDLVKSVNETLQSINTNDRVKAMEAAANASEQEK